MLALPEFLSDVAKYGATISFVGDKLRCDAPKTFHTPERKEALVAYKETLHALLKPIAEHPPSEAGKVLLAPYLPVIQAAHRGELPAIVIKQGGQDVDLSDYICQVSAGLWYGVTLKSPLVPAWRENLRRLQVWYEAETPTASARLPPLSRDNG